MTVTSRIITSIIACVACICIAAGVFAQDEKAETGLPVPRFVSLKSDEVNMRRGPGERYAIKWVYKHDGLPVEVIQEFDAWREIRDSDGTVGWVHKQMLQSKRMAIIKSKVGVLRKSAASDAPPVVRAEAGVVGKIIECQIDWCKIQIASHKGWVSKTDIWGVYPSEKF